jgi:hypothetical protein
MTSWIILGVAYVFAIGFFRILGGVGAAGDAIERWGRATAARRRSSSVSPISR